MGEYMGISPPKRVQDEAAPAFGHILCCPNAFIWEPSTPARQPTSTWSSSRRAATKTTPELELSLQLAQLALLEASTKLSPLPMQLVASLENNAPGPCSTWAFLLSSSQTSWVEMNWNTSVFPQY